MKSGLIRQSLVFAVLASASTFVSAQGYSGPSTPHYSGPSSVAGMTVKQLLETGADDQYVTLRGKLVRHTGGEHYVLADASGEIEVEISSKYFPQNVTISPEMTLELNGKYDKKILGKSKLEVKKMIVVMH
ncbi:NirD/YgiW/YdeI family stress tolerance protein [Paraburkholderia bonniea]|uniref:YgiW/YdeI family stress tolerance OB fold protein n=1 Tax=Paraburkholderia bonniea TaxID=2152891 RepID=UPI00129235A0|nr:NirD/YgiW/YdeI family stress tolerance protein [Paraburkholderia bonniea]WJF89146.1 NirD/YgiW/YdeI family stress tolerance protein [Paraburkholderia bonniea]WJF92462.1 NirD/YgiW/YdeI family stress tolerance protein [Paraburkholderia bonniea]